ncbi:FecCD family ABC transporter permease [Cohnella faecalis]|uniref:Iron ABC transporter permease n=1 Tax=Cohnella faecalis TaxID=2315694 RepID=A0A398D0Z7_9BACL|nr:iron ABC transporter permease [Cohnella faecalis]RIE04844.1 iron ABC transporter permease [Cohnella faecalis]
MTTTIRWCLLLGGMLALAIMASLTFGDAFVSPIRAMEAVIGKGTIEEGLLVRTLRLPRTVVALLVGASLAAAGTLLQGAFRNPLAAPDLIGVTGGASVAAVAFVVLRPATLSIAWLPAVTMAGAAVVSALVLALARKGGTLSPTRLILVGIGVGAFMSAMTTMLVVFSPMHTATEAYIWLTGTVYGSSWKHVSTLLPWTVVFLSLAIMNGRRLNALMLGDELATGIGNAVERSRLSVVALSVALAGSAVSMGGVIGFVGLLAPHVARKLVGPLSSRAIPVSALLGGIIVVTADLAARTLFLPLDIPVGVFTSGVGAPFFIYLLFRTRNIR